MFHFTVLEQQTQVEAGITWHLKWSCERRLALRTPHHLQVVAKKPIFILLRAGGLMPERSTIHKKVVLQFLQVVGAIYDHSPAVRLLGSIPDQTSWNRWFATNESPDSIPLSSRKYFDLAYRQSFAPCLYFIVALKWHWMSKIFIPEFEFDIDGMNLSSEYEFEFEFETKRTSRNGRIPRRSPIQVLTPPDRA